ncbi:hypothetical protein SAMN05660350_04237 [Geodermatophilus obscurus]|uniref:Uncharacterized protein n=1 Tax=Geodermatophilus obscurus TaxID=1861 RepID=A0A1M7UXX9_9ACTN|nr:hypothetical protein SAMN05660350_04237 [Geodermatophilus obscurus]
MSPVGPAPTTRTSVLVVMVVTSPRAGAGRRRTPARCGHRCGSPGRGSRRLAGRRRTRRPGEFEDRPSTRCLAHAVPDEVDHGEHVRSAQVGQPAHRARDDGVGRSPGDLVDVDRLDPPPARHEYDRQLGHAVEQLQHEAVEQGGAQDGPREPGPPDRLLGGQLGPVVVRRDSVDADDGDVDDVRSAGVAGGLQQPLGSFHVDRPGPPRGPWRSGRSRWSRPPHGADRLRCSGPPPGARRRAPAARPGSGSGSTPCGRRPPGRGPPGARAVRCRR